MALCNYSFYLNNFGGGKVPQDKFKGISERATAEIYSQVNDKCDCFEAKMCCCELSDLIYDNSNKTSGVSSESVGGWSISYGSPSEQEEIYKQNVTKIIDKWLSKTGLLYCGVNLC